MKISDEEAIAALNSWIPEIRPATCEAYVKDMRAALAAAYTVRKARKAAKRAKVKPSILDEDQQDAMGQEIPALSYQSWYGNGELFHSAQAVPEPAKPEHRLKVGDRVVHDIHGLGTVERAGIGQCPYLVEFAIGTTRWCSAGRLSPYHAAPEWNGKFEVGKAYRTRDGRKAEVADVRIGNKYPINGRVPGIGHWLCWNEYGGYAVYCTEHHLDLIGPWED